MSGLATALLVGIGGAMGALARYGVGTRLPGSTATVVVNVLGSAIAGALLAAELPDSTVALAAIGFCGAFTTFSSLAVEVVVRLERDEHVSAFWYASATLGTALLGVSVGAIAVSGGMI